MRARSPSPAACRIRARRSSRRCCARRTRSSASIRDAVRIVGALPSVHTFVSGILVVPFVGMLATMPAVDRERRGDRRGAHLPGDASRGGRAPWCTTTWTEADLERVRLRARRRDDLGRHGLDAPHVARDDQEGHIVADPVIPVVPDDETLRRILAEARTIAVVGLSSKPGRASLDVGHSLQERGYRIVPVNPRETEVLGETAYPSLRDIPEELHVDIVDVFRRAEDTPDDRPRCGGDRRQGALAPARHRERGSGSHRVDGRLGRHHGGLHQADRATLGPRPGTGGTQRWVRP